MEKTAVRTPPTETDAARPRATEKAGSGSDRDPLSPPRFADLLERMTPAERLRAYRSAALSRHERSVWAARHPEEVPLLNDEFEWIALSLADLD
jgi:hypothetical protein